MQVDSTAPFTSVARAMGQAAQAPPSPADNDADEKAGSAKASNPPGVGETVDVTA